MTESVYAHFIGIGGAGMSGIARVLHDRELAVTGSDLKMSRYARSLEEAGVRVFIGHDAAQVGDPGVVVVSSAIPKTNPELIEAERRGMDVWPRARMLAHLAGTQRTVAVAGTHGKTTTSSMLACALDGAGLDPTFLIGGEILEMGANARCGSGAYYVVEADESDGSFLYLEPHLALVTNIEADHLDHYRSLAQIEGTFAEFLGRVAEEGVAVLNGDDRRLLGLASHVRGRVVTYGEDEDCDVRCTALAAAGMGYRAEVTFPDRSGIDLAVAVPGRHNAHNATGVLASAWALEEDVEKVARSLATFRGVRRRFEVVGEVDGVTVVDDYAHHPTEVRATLAAARQGSWRRVWVVFQPHRYSRTAALGRQFGAVFEGADRLVLMDVYGAGETPIPGVSGKTLVDAVLAEEPRKTLAYFPHRIDVEGYVASQAGSGDLVMTMGAGDVTSMGAEIVRALSARAAGA